MRRGLISLLLFLLVLCVDKLTRLCCWGGVVFVGFCLGFLLLCFFLCLFRFLCVCSLASVFCHCCWCCCFCCCGCCDSLVVLLMVLWLLWYSRRFSYGVFECFWLFELTVAILLDLYEIVTSRSSGVFCCFDWQLLLFLNCMIIQPPPPHRVRMLVFFVALLLLLLLFLWYSCSRSSGSFTVLIDSCYSSWTVWSYSPLPHTEYAWWCFCCCCCCCCRCCCCCCDILVVVLTRLLFYLTVAIVLQLYACATPEATNAPQTDPSWLNKHLKLRQTRVDSNLWPRGTVPELPSGTKGRKTSIWPTLLTT